jgi:hypothetical protein
MWNSGTGTPANVENADPAWRWQFLQWQTPVIAGGLSKLYLILPHRHCPVVDMVVLSLFIVLIYSKVFVVKTNGVTMPFYIVHIKGIWRVAANKIYPG